MKRLLFLLAMVPMVTFSQNRFKEVFTRADSAFYEAAKMASVDAAMKTDSILGIRDFYNSIYECEFGTDKKVTITWNDYLNEYMNAYMLGQLSYQYHNGFNYELLHRKLKKIKRELRKIKE